MKFSSGFTLCSIAALATASLTPVGHEYIPPTKKNGFVRSPCPGLNSLANHGWIPRSGKLVLGGYPGIGIDQSFMTSIGGLALLSPDKPNGLTFDLDDLKEHNFPIEHDVSLTREDYYFHHDDLTFQPYLYKRFMKHFKGRKETSLKTSALARYARVNDSLTNNPHVTYGAIDFLFSYGESGLYTQTMGMSPLARKARVDYVRDLFLYERLPYELGWTPSVVPITLATLGGFATQMFAVQPEKLPTGMEVLTKGTFVELITAYVALQQKLHNITGT